MKRLPFMKTTTALTAALMLGMSAPTGAFAATQAELDYWTSVETSGTTADYRAYIKAYPDGDFVKIAQNRIADDREAALNLSYADRRAIQAQLVKEGYNTRGVDGVFGPGTRGAITAWQEERGRLATGYLTEAQAEALLKARATGGDSNAEVIAEREQRREELRAIEDALAFDDKQRAEIEERLMLAGYSVGEIDGKFTAETRKSIWAFRRDNEMEKHGFLSREMVQELVRETNAQYSARSENRTSTGKIDSEVAAAVGLGALLIGGAILLSD